MEKSKIHYATVSWLTLLFAVASLSAARVEAMEPGNRSSSLLEGSPGYPALSHAFGCQQGPAPQADRQQRQRLVLEVNTNPSPADSMAQPRRSPEQDSTKRTVYFRRTYVSRGLADEVKPYARIFVASPGPVGSAKLPLAYLGVAGPEITINGLPFLFNGIYRPYVIGTDLNVLPWEILREIKLEMLSHRNTLDVSLGRPLDLANRSDVEVARGPYGYSASRWRFFRPFTESTYGYLTVGFKKSSGFIENSDYNGYHVTGGFLKLFSAGTLELDLWRHRARLGQNSFDFLTPQLSRQSRGIDRGTLRLNLTIKSPLTVSLAGLLQESAQTVSGYGKELKPKHDIGGGEVFLSDSLSGVRARVGVKYYRVGLFGVPSVSSPVSISEYSFKIDNNRGRFELAAALKLAWNGIDKSVLLPSASVVYRWSSRYRAGADFSRERKLPDLYLLYLDDRLTDLGAGETLKSYHFRPNPELSSPVMDAAALWVTAHYPGLEWDFGLSLKRIESQTALSYSDSAGDFVVTPYNFDDQFAEIFASVKAQRAPFSAEMSAVYRRWNQRFLPNGLEKGPMAIGFGRVSILKELFISDLYLGGSLEARASSRRDYGSITIGLTDGFLVLFGRLEFRYKAFTFWFNNDNLTNTAYTTWWPYFEAPRNLWWGFRWRFYD